MPGTSKGSTSQVNLEYLKELIDLHNDQLLAQDKINIKKEISFNYQMQIFTIFLLVMIKN